MARLDNALELRSQLRLPVASDAELVLAAYGRWGAACAVRLRGDWSLVVYEPDGDRVFLMRDQLGTATIFFAALQDRVVVSTRRAVALALAPSDIDVSRLAALIAGVPPSDPSATLRKAVRSVPRGHVAVIRPSGVQVERYWDPLSEVATAGSAQDLMAALESATSRRLGPARNAVALSGGLDSTALLSVASTVLPQDCDRLLALTSTNAYPADAFVRRGEIGDELEGALAAAGACDTDLVPVDAGAVSPVVAMRDVLDVVHEPVFGGVNAFWMLELARAARARGVGSLLVAARGNHTISWRGSPFSLGSRYAAKRLGWRAVVRQKMGEGLPSEVALRIRAIRARPDFLTRTALHPRLWANRDIRAQLVEGFVGDYYRDPIGERADLLRANTGSQFVEICAAHGVALRDPTADLDVVRAALAIPDAEHIDPATGMQRMVIRRLMEGRLPDSVRLNRRFGSQGADVVLRLRTFGADVEEALDEVERGEGAAYVDVPRMRDAWARVRAEDSPESLRIARHVLGRGLMAGLAVNKSTSA